MATTTSTGCKIYIGSKTTALASETAWVEVGEVENLNEFGDVFTPVLFTSLNDGRVRKGKGTADAGDLALVVGFDGDDTGQIALKAAAADTTSSPYNFRVTLNNAPPFVAPATGSTPTEFRFRALVMGLRFTVGAADSTVTAATTISITTEITETAAATTGP